MTDAAEKAVDEIIADIRGRRGLRQEWESIDVVTREDIRTEWIRVVRQSMRGGER